MNIDKINKETVRRIAHLADIEFDKKEMSRFVKEFKQILHFLNKLNKPELPVVSLDRQPRYKNHFLREDEVSESLSLTRVFMNTKSKKKDFFTVPKMINNEYKKE